MDGLTKAVGVVGFEGVGVGEFEGQGDACAPGAEGVAGVDEDCVFWGGEDVPAVICEGECLLGSFWRHEGGFGCEMGDDDGVGLGMEL